MQRLTIRVVIATFTFLIGVTATLVWFTFRPSENEPTSPITPIPVSPLAAAPPMTLIPATTVPVEFFGWWCCGEYCECVDPGSPKTTYIRLEEWVSGVSGDVPEPDYIDIVYHLKNNESQTRTFVVSAVGDFKWAKPGLGVHDGSEKEPEELLVRVPWKGQQSIGRRIIRGVAPGEVRDVKFENFNLRAVTQKYLSEDFSRLDLWPWKFRVSITVKTLGGKFLDKEQGVLNVIPGD